MSAPTRAMKRKALSKTIRFEVFKRDSFKCQYCGQSAPDVILHVDHIAPVAKGGTNDIANLVTACLSCNAGKSATPLSDDTAIKKAKRQLDQLQERREQIEMMAAWHQGLVNLEDQSTDVVCSLWSSLVDPWELNDKGRQEARQYVQRFGLSEVLESVRISVAYYVQREDGKPTKDSIQECWRKVGGICAVRKRDREQPGYKDINYIRAIVRNKLDGRYFDYRKAGEWIEYAISCGATVDELKSVVTGVQSWSHFVEVILAIAGSDLAGGRNG
jgi:hypothetical protein